MRRVEGRDAIFLYMETPNVHQHASFAGVLDPSTVPGGISHPREIYDRVKELIASRLHLFPPFRWRLVEVPLQLDHPVFIEDPAFDLDFHVRRAALPSPGGLRELADYLSEVHSRPMDRGHPLWELHVVEGLEGGRWALVGKAHHVIIDGVGGSEMMIHLLDLSPEPRVVEPPESPWTPDPVPSDAKLLALALARNLINPPRLARQVLRTTGTVARMIRDRIARQEQDGVVTLGPRTMLNRPVTAHRQVALGSIPLEDVRFVKRTFGCKVNDVVLAICGRALRGFLREHGEDPDRPLVAACPISIRQEGEGALGNRVAGMTVPLADHLEDPVAQLEAIRSVTARAKERLGAVTADLMRDWTQYATPALAVQAFRFYSSLGLQEHHPPVANLTISNVPGPPIPLYVAGSKLETMYPLGPLVHGQGLNITVVSYLDTMFVGVVSCPDTVPDTWPLVAGIEKALAELVAAGRERSGTGPAEG